ncbi:hypothetical protein RJ640_005288, partial [Escallonia rubra]
MSQKRQQDEGKASEDKRQKVPSFKNWDLQKEQIFNGQVKEEVESALRKYLTSMKRSCGKEIQPSETRSLQLQFLNALSLPVFTGTRIEGEECTTLKLALRDAVTWQVVSSGPESSAKVEIVVLEGDFDGDEGDNWVLEEFRTNIVREREGKKPLLSGDVILNLKEGIGFVGEISFTDNSSWTRSRKFRLGARVVDNCDGIRIREAKTDSFIVRDHRGELYKKHHPPSLFDEVWRLENIEKEGAFHERLSRENVSTVRDFLVLLFVDPTRLRSILGTGMSTKMWEITVEHARTCVLDKKLYLYPPGSQQKTRVVFNVVGQLMGLFSDDQYADALNLIISAYKNWEEVVAFDDEASLVDGFSRFSNTLYPSNSPMAESSDRFDYPQLSGPSPDIMPSIFAMGGSLDDYGLQTIDTMDEKEESAGEKLLPPLKRSSENEIRTSDPRRFKLQFFNKISSPVLTKETIQGVEGASIPVAIVDCHTGQVVTSGPAASAEVDIMALQGDLDNVTGEDWTPEVFEKEIVREIQGKKNLLKGSLRLKLKDGVSSILGAGAKLKVPVDHARTCTVTDKIYLYYSPNLEPNTGVKEEVESALRKYLTCMKRSCGKEIQPSETRSLQLQFLNALSLPVFTGTRIEGEECTTLKLALSDAVTGQVVSSGPESSAKVEIVVLEGDFDGDEGDNWVLEEFRTNIVREREGKKHLLSGDVILNLKEGIGFVGEISFTDNSSWTRSRKFRLGARVVDNCDGIRIREAKTDSFIVRDHRGELYKKHHPPSLFDEVWRLEKIGKEGAFHKRLSRENVSTVRDFLILLFVDPTRLRSADALNLIISAYKNWEEVVAFDDEASLVDGFSRFSNTLYPSNPPMAESSDRFDYPQLSGPSPDIMPSIFGMGGSLDDYGLQTIDTMDVRFDQSMSFSGHGANSLICDTDSISQSICENEVMKYFDECPLQNSSLDSQADLHSAVSGFLFPPTAVTGKKKLRGDGR